ncbi:protoporphyrinogen oxidase HemJ [Hyphomicrobium sp.]|uniref:protoporphyrinogen oxidase HemJ n=1 Tax=Hyphomicrobium sp. TaxID=82 RepID=UPI001E0D9BB3|nr:protoporphyrinogen oxidase HemJ [Hyphomicrobium sp.]MBY0560645.1 protoporphyrinogen oxidase HemJ [Hyphomicrobium sp.]
MSDAPSTVSPSAGSPARRAAIALVVTILMAAAFVAIFPADAYLWIKSFHVIAIIAWMAAMLYLPRLFVYHAEAPIGSAQSENFKVMEGRLLNIIATPAMIIAWVLGLWLVTTGHFWSAPWFHAKITLVLILSGLHGYLSASARAFREDRNTKPARHWRIINEVPAVLMIGIVILVIVKPF